MRFTEPKHTPKRLSDWSMGQSDILEAIDDKRELLDAPGVYVLHNSVSGLVYVGRSKTSIRKRTAFHLVRLMSGKHENRYMQEDYNRCGAGCLSAHLLTYCCDGDSVFVESISIDAAAGMGCYNQNGGEVSRIRRERRESLGLQMMHIFAHKDDANLVLEYVSGLNKSRGIERT